MNDIVKHQPTAPAQRGSGALSLASMTPHDAWKFAEALAGSGMLPRQYQGNPASILWALEYGRAIGLDVITTTQSVHVIQGRATASADLMASLTRRAGHRMRISGDDQRAEVVIIRADDPEFEFRAVWDTAKAQRAGLVKKDTWQQYPGSMLRARAISECVRMACPEVLHGSIYTPEEIGARVDADGVPLDAEVQQLRPVQAAQVGEERQDYMVRIGNVVVRRDAFQPHAEGQAIADRAKAAKDRAEVKSLWGEALDAEVINSGILAPDDGEPCMLRDYLTRLGKGLPDAALAENDGVMDVDAVDDQGDDHAAAVAELQAFAAEQQIADIDDAAYGALGLPLDEASPDAIRGLLAQLRGTAA